jgi:hypothetical protein
MKNFFKLSILSLVSLNALAEDLQLNGSNKIYKIKDINKKIESNGTFQLQNSTIRELKSNGMAKIYNSDVKVINGNGLVLMKKSKSDQIFVKGTIKIQNSNIKKIIIDSNGKIIKIQDKSNVDKILVENSDIDQVIQVVNSTVKEVEFKSKKGTIEHDSKSKITTVIGGNLVKKDAKELLKSNKKKKEKAK